MIRSLFSSLNRALFVSFGLASPCIGCSATQESTSVGIDTQDQVANVSAELRQRPPACDNDLSPLARYTHDLLTHTVQSRAKLTLVFVLDGMRPDFVTPTLTPHLYNLRQAGVNFVNGHSVFPTVTRVNSPSIATGYYPETAGIVGNSIYIPEIDKTGEISTGDWRNLKKLDEVSGGRLLFVKSLAERLHAVGKTLAAVSSGSSGSALLLNHRAPSGIGILVNGYLEGETRVGYPDAVSAEILRRFGPAPSSSGTGGLTEPTNWAEEVLRDYVIPELHPDVVLNWITQPDGAQHSYGAGSPQALESIRNDDRNIGLILDKLRALNLYDQTNIFVVSDHGFGVHTYQVNLTQSLIDAGLKTSATSDDVALASSSHVAMIHVKRHNRHVIKQIVRHLQKQPWAGVIFTRAEQQHSRNADLEQGWVPGTFSLELIHQANAERGADIVVSFDWSSDKNAFGVEGTDTTLGSGTTGPRSGNASGHGSMSPWTVRNTWFAWGADFKDNVIDRVPASNVDIVPTILALQGINPRELDGRVLFEALEGGPDYEKVPQETQTFVTRAPDSKYRAVIQVTQVGHQRYIDKSWRLPE